ncbi:hypothetical protein Tco_0542223 [Tanacetum coccineum]
MLEKQIDPISKEKKVNIAPIDYSKLNKIKEDFGKRFITQNELDAEQAFWLKLSNHPSITLVVSHTPVKVEAPRKLPKVSLVNESLKKLKYQLANFDKVMKNRTTSDAITAGAWGFEHTKACFVIEIIPFLKVLKDTFNAFDKTLLDEIIEVQTVFNQMEAAVDQCSVDKNDFELKLKQLQIDNDQLLNQIMSQEIMHIAMNSVDILDVNKSCVDECIIEKLKDRIKSLMDKEGVENVKKDIDEIETINIELEHSVAKLLSENENLRNEREHLKSIYKDQENIVDTTISKPLATTIAPRMFKLNLEPLAHKLLQSKDVHMDYIKHSRDHADILREIVENARALSPLDSNLDSTCKYVQRIQEVLVYVRETCPYLSKLSEKLVAVTPMNKDKKVRFADPLTSLCNTQKSQDSNKHFLYSTGVICSTSASRSKPSSNTKNNRISQASSRNKTNNVEDQSRSIKSRKNKKNRFDK